MKLFKDVQKGEHIFILQPGTLNKVFEAEVKASALHPKSVNKKVWVIEFYIPFKDNLVDASALKEAEKLGTKTATQIFVNADASSVLVAFKPQPTLLCTTKLEMDKFTGSITPGDLADFLQMKQNAENQKQAKRPWR